MQNVEGHGGEKYPMEGGGFKEIVTYDDIIMIMEQHDNNESTVSNEINDSLIYPTLDIEGKMENSILINNLNKETKQDENGKTVRMQLY